MANNSLAETCVDFADAVAITVGDTGRDSALFDQLLRASGAMAYRAVCSARGEDPMWREAYRAADETLFWLRLCEKGRMLPEASLVRLEKRGRVLKRKLKTVAQKTEEHKRNDWFKKAGETVLTTSRLYVRGCLAADASLLRSLCDEEYRMSGLPSYDTDEAASAAILAFKSDGTVFSLCHKGSDEVVGYVGLMPTTHGAHRRRLVLAIGEAYRRRGYASEVLEPIVAYGFESLGASVIAVELYTPFLRQTLLRYGFLVEGTLYGYGADREDVEFLSMTRDAWEARKHES